ncbi:hypothetical protein AMV028 [Betaentomopoxvirus amoorei]|uniref:AMV028 n=1 Tax=Amsacta moorei entomopoxvirus TaxID=28321 RepID=Q9EN20_AMEPV|nr:hypothetical protein AMV028 [Amsacta moorei entomopoxvirus]AAG02734.1 AMV028 [Amsacta moorei entomopoxvirus]
MDKININTYINNNLYNINVDKNSGYIPAIEIIKDNFNKDIHIEAYSDISSPKYIFTNNNNFILKNIKISNNRCEFDINVKYFNNNFIIGFYITNIYKYIKNYDPYYDILQEIYDNNMYTEKYIQYALLTKHNKVKYRKIRYVPYYNFYNVENYIF